MTKLEAALVQAAKAFVEAMQNGAVSEAKVFPIAKSALGFKDGFPICNLHGKTLKPSKSPRDPEKDYYYCPTKDEQTGKWCSTRAGKSQSA